MVVDWSVGMSDQGRGGWNGTRESRLGLRRMDRGLGRANYSRGERIGVRKVAEGRRFCRNKVEKEATRRRVGEEAKEEEG